MEQLKQTLQEFKRGWQARDQQPRPAWETPLTWAIRVVFLVVLAVILLRK